uniref:hypothetical protein n=1 Tax=unclassified Serratia (in: enterobacteria) TaxID=2647522 RepID=UPI00307634E6
DTFIWTLLLLRLDTQIVAHCDAVVGASISLSLPVSPERTVLGAFAYALRLRSAPSMASTPVLTSPISLF